MILIPKIVQVLSDLLEKVKDATEVHFFAAQRNNYDGATKR